MSDKTAIQKMVELLQETKGELSRGLSDPNIAGVDKHTLQEILALFDMLITTGKNMTDQGEKNAINTGNVKRGKPEKANKCGE